MSELETWGTVRPGVACGFVMKMLSFSRSPDALRTTIFIEGLIFTRICSEEWSRD